MAASNRLLVADDSLTIQKVIRLALSNEGYDIQAVSDGNDAVEQIFLFRPNLVLVDVSLPGLNAFEVKREINRHPEHAQVRFVLMSSAFEKIDEIQAADVKFQGRLTKPFDPAHLRQILVEALGKTVGAAHPQSPLPSPSFPPPFAGGEDGDEVESAGGPPQFQAMDQEDYQPSVKFSPPPFHGLPPALAQSLSQSPPPSLPGGGPPQFPSALPDSDSDPNFSGDLLPEPPEELPGEGEAFPSSPPGFPPSPGEEFLSDSYHPESSESEIRHLTDTTFQMADSDANQWSVSPPPHPMPSFANEPPLQIRPETDISKFLVPPPAAPAQPPQPPVRPEAAQLPFDQRAYAPAPPVMPQMQQAMPFPPHPGAFVQPIEPPPPGMDPSRVHLGLPPSGASGAFNLSEEKVEKIVKTQVEQLIQRLIQNSLPDIAEKLIKQEIHKMLSDPSL